MAVLLAEDERVVGPGTLPAADEEALFREARRLRRRRWIKGALAVAVLVGVVVGIVSLVAAPGGHRTTAAGAATVGILPNGPLAKLTIAGPLAVAGDGALYVTDLSSSSLYPGGDRILVRLPDGRFRVVAGDGRRGFSGDGGRAVDAELSGVSDLVFARDDTLYIADGARVRTISRDGVIRTIAGNGKRGETIANGTPALAAALSESAGNPLEIALSPTGELYVATGARQLLRLAANGRLYNVRAVFTAGRWKGQSVGGWYPIAIDAHGNIDEGGGPGGRVITQVAPDGVAHRLAGFARGSGGSNPILQTGPGGAVYVEHEGISRIQGNRLLPAYTGTPIDSDELRLNGQYFPTLYFAFAPNGTVYADDLPGNMGFEFHQQLLAVRDHHTSLLWQEHNKVPH
jgi:hypothetical protein